MLKPGCTLQPKQAERQQLSVSDSDGPGPPRRRDCRATPGWRRLPPYLARMFFGPSEPSPRCGCFKRLLATSPSEATGLSIFFYFEIGRRVSAQQVLHKVVPAA